jgi:hypothetical protein
VLRALLKSLDIQDIGTFFAKSSRRLAAAIWLFWSREFSYLR